MLLLLSSCSPTVSPSFVKLLLCLACWDVPDSVVYSRHSGIGTVFEANSPHLRRLASLLSLSKANRKRGREHVMQRLSPQSKVVVVSGTGMAT